MCERESFKTSGRPTAVVPAGAVRSHQRFIQVCSALALLATGFVAAQYVLAQRFAAHVAVAVEGQGGVARFDYYGPRRLREWCERNEWRGLAKLVHIEHGWGGQAIPSLDEGTLQSVFEVTSLRLIQLDDRRVSDDHVARLRGRDHVRVLGLIEPTLSEIGLGYIGQIRGLRELTLTGVAISEDFGTSLCEMDSLVVLNLSRCQCNGALADISRLARLEMLFLKGASLTAEDFTAISQLRSLQSLTVSETAFDDEALSSLVGIATLEEIECVEANVSADGVRRFLAERPDVTIAHESLSIWGSSD